jgi:hypothetical protein
VTGCVLISPEEIPFPIIVSDVAVTVPGSKLDLRPGRLPVQLSRTNQGPEHLARKSYILSDRCAVALAGSASDIEDFLTFARPVLNQAAAGGRPMRDLGQYADSFSGNVELVGAYVMEDGRRNLVRPNATGTQLMGRLGQVSAIGSGRDALLRVLRSYERMFPADQSSGTVAFNAARNLNQSRIYEEIFSNPKDSSWGGYLESLIWNHELQRWIRSPKALCLHYQVLLNGMDCTQSGLVNRVIAYDPTGPGRLLTVLYHPEAGIHANDFVLRDLLDGGTEVPDSKTQWIDWVPKEVLVTVAVASKVNDDGSFFGRISHFNYEVSDLRKTRLSVGRESFSLEVDEEAIEYFLEEAKRSLLAGDEFKVHHSPF